MALKEIKTDEELKILRDAGQGYIYNDYGTKYSGKEGNVLHRASCGFTQTMTVSTGKWYFDTDNEAIDWLEKNRKEIGYILCGSCIKDKTQYSSKASLVKEGVESIDLTLNLIISKKQIILYGPPGTGKTYNTKTISINILENNN